MYSLAQDPASLGLAAPLMATLPSEVISAVPPRFRDRDHRWVGVSGRIRAIIYDRDQVRVSELPTSIDDLLNPRWSNMIGVAPTNGSFLAFVAAMILDRGESANPAMVEGPGGAGSLGLSQEFSDRGCGPMPEKSGSAWSTITTCFVCRPKGAGNGRPITSSRPEIREVW